MWRQCHYHACIHLAGTGHLGNRSKVELLHRNVQRFRGGLVFKAHRRVHHSTLGWRVIKKRRRSDYIQGNTPKVSQSPPEIRGERAPAAAKWYTCIYVLDISTQNPNQYSGPNHFQDQNNQYPGPKHQYSGPKYFKNKRIEKNATLEHKNTRAETNGGMTGLDRERVRVRANREQLNRASEEGKTH